MSTSSTGKNRRAVEAPWKPSDFIARSPVFRFDDFVAAHTAGGRSPASSAAILRYHAGQGRVRSLRRGVWAHPGWVDPWVLGSRLTHDAIVAYDGALSFHGLSGLGYGLTILSRERLTHFVHQDVVYKAVRPPRGPGDTAGVLERERAGQTLKVTSKERTLVDLLDRLDLAPEPGALFVCFLKARPLDARAMVRHAVALKNRLVCARLGFFLEPLLPYRDPALEALERRCPKAPAYFDRARREGKQSVLPRWNLMVPHALALKIQRRHR